MKCAQGERRSMLEAGDDAGVQGDLEPDVEAYEMLTAPECANRVKRLFPASVDPHIVRPADGTAKCAAFIPFVPRTGLPCILSGPERRATTRDQN